MRVKGASNIFSQQAINHLVATSQSQYKMEGRLLLDVVVGQGSTILQLFTSEDQSLLIWRNSFLILDLSLNILNAIAGLNLQGDGLSSQGLYKDLHTSSQSQHKMEGGLLLDVVIGQSSTILQLFTSEDQSLLIWGNTFLILDLSFDILNAVAGFN